MRFHMKLRSVLREKKREKGNERKREETKMTIREGTMKSNGELVLHLITIQRKGMVNAEEVGL